MNFLSIYLIAHCLDNPRYHNGFLLVLPYPFLFPEAPKFSVLLLEKVVSLPQLDIHYGHVALCWLLRDVSNISVVTLMTWVSPFPRLVSLSRLTAPS